MISISQIAPHLTVSSQLSEKSQHLKASDIISTRKPLGFQQNSPHNLVIACSTQCGVVQIVVKFVMSNVLLPPADEVWGKVIFS